MEVRLDQNFKARKEDGSLQENCGTERDNLTPHESDRLTSGAVSETSQQKRFLQEPPHVLKAMITR